MQHAENKIVTPAAIVVQLFIIDHHTDTGHALDDRAAEDNQPGSCFIPRTT
jgi:hypothetical protein